MADIANVGVAVAVVAATPATVDAAGFAALGWTAAVGFLVSWGETGDTSSDVTIDLLSGRTLHLNGGVDGGEVPFEYAYDHLDAGQVILRAQSNSQTTVSVRETHTDGRVVYYHGKVANLKDKEKTSKTNKGQSGVLRINSPLVRV